VSAFTVMRFDRIVNVLKQEPFFTEALAGATVTMRGRKANKKCRYPSFVLVVADVLDRQGLDAHTVEKAVILRTAFELAHPDGAGLQTAPAPQREMTSLDLPPLPPNNTGNHAMKFADKLKEMLTEAECGVRLLTTKVDDCRSKLVELELQLSLAKAEVELARRAVASLPQETPPPPAEPPAEPPEPPAEPPEPPAPEAGPDPQAAAASAKAIKAKLGPIVAQLAPKPAPERPRYHDQTLRQTYGAGALDSLVVARWAGKYELYINKCLSLSFAPTSSDAKKLLQTDRLRVNFIRWMLEHVPRNDPVLRIDGVVLRSPVLADVKALAWWIALLAPSGLANLTDAEVSRYVSQLVETLPHGMPRL
jgi:hypothetical protein